MPGVGPARLCHIGRYLGDLDSPCFCARRQLLACNVVCWLGAGEETSILTGVVSFSAQVVGVKPTSVALPNMAVLTNQQALCPNSRVLAEYEHVFSVDEARAKCENHACSHFTWFVEGSRSTPEDALRLRLWYASTGVDACPHIYHFLNAAAAMLRQSPKKVALGRV